jgi:hypothetical protein
VKAVIDRVLEQELKGKVYDVEEAKEWSINICENIKSAVKGSDPLIVPRQLRFHSSDQNFACFLLAYPIR